MKILIVANHFFCCSARYAADAFVRLKHDVRHIGPAMGNRIWGLSLPERYTWEPDDPFYQEEQWWDDGCHEADLCIVMDSDPAMLDFVRGFDFTPRVVWGVDNHVRDYRRPWFQHYFLAHRGVSLMPWYADGDLDREYDDMTQLPCAADSQYFPRSTIPWEQRTWDVACLGVPYPQRMQLIDAMKNAGLKVIWGQGLVYESYASIYQDARVSLCVSAAGDVGQRIYETARMGCAVLSDPLRDLNWPHPIIQYQNVEYAVKIARSLQHDPARGEVCAGWAINETWDARCQTLLATCAERGLISEVVTT